MEIKMEDTIILDKGLVNVQRDSVRLKSDSEMMMARPASYY